MSIKIEITENEAESLLDFIEVDFLEALRNDSYIDNFNYVCNICGIYKQIKKAVEEQKK